MKVQIDPTFDEEIRKNKWLIKIYKEFVEAQKSGKTTEFLNDNPDFLQMIMHLAYSEKIKIIDNE